MLGDKYIHVQTLGKGVFGKVTLVRRKDDQRLIALKTINYPIIESKKERESKKGEKGRKNKKKENKSKKQRERRDRMLMELKREVNTLKKLDHPNIVRIYHHSISKDKSSATLEMEYIVGKTLETYTFAEENDYSIEGHKLQFFNLLAQFFSALHFMHSKRIVHRDIQPLNIMITDQSDLVKIVDFGLACKVDKAIFKLTKKNRAKHGSGGTVLCGVPGKSNIPYLSPEFLDTKSRPTNMLFFKADVWAAGITWYYAIHKQFPFNTRIDVSRVGTRSYMSEMIADHLEIKEVYNIPELYRLFRGMLDRNVEERWDSYQCFEYCMEIQQSSIVGLRETAAELLEYIESSILSPRYHVPQTHLNQNNASDMKQMYNDVISDLSRSQESD